MKELLFVLLFIIEVYFSFSNVCFCSLDLTILSQLVLSGKKIHHP